jgi:hypothetical protein
MGQKAVELLMLMADTSRKLLIYGDIGGNSSVHSSVIQRNGQAYLEGGRTQCNN